MRGLYVALGYYDDAELRNLAESSFQYPSNPRVAGWYLRASAEDGYADIVKYVHIPQDSIPAVAKCLLDTLLKQREVEAGTTLHSQFAHQLDAQARERAKKIERLRRQREEIEASLAILKSEADNGA